MFTEAAWRTSNLGTPALSVSDGKGLLIEAILTFVLVMVIWGTGIDERGPRVGGFAIGGVLGGMVLAFGPLTGVGLNPARFLGPAAVAGHVDDWWVYFLGPIDRRRRRRRLVPHAVLGWLPVGTDRGVAGPGAGHHLVRTAFCHRGAGRDRCGARPQPRDHDGRRAKRGAQRITEAQAGATETARDLTETAVRRL